MKMKILKTLCIIWLLHLPACATTEKEFSVVVPPPKSKVALKNTTRSTNLSGINQSSVTGSVPPQSLTVTSPALDALPATLSAFKLPVDIASQNRVALVIGNANYQHTTSLRNPYNDASAIASSLRELGFDVVLGTDSTKSQLDEDIKSFSSKASGADVALFYYSGHAMQIDGKNWMVPVDAHLRSPSDVSLHANAMDLVLEQMGAKATLNLVFLDACRDNPFQSTMYADSRSAAKTKGLSRIADREGELYVAFATAPGEVALDGDGNFSPFSEAIIRHIKTPAIDIDELMRRVRKDVKNQTAGKNIKQIPWNNSSLTERFYFAGAPVS